LLSLFSTPVKILLKFADFLVNFTIIFEIQTTDVCNEIVTERWFSVDEGEKVLLNWPPMFYLIESDYQSINGGSQ